MILFNKDNSNIIMYSILFLKIVLIILNPNHHGNISDFVAQKLEHLFIGWDIDYGGR